MRVKEFVSNLLDLLFIGVMIVGLFGIPLIYGILYPVMGYSWPNVIAVLVIAGIVIAYHCSSTR